MRLEAYRADLIVASKVIIEIKSIETVTQVAFRALLTYLRVADKRLGLLINFSVVHLNDGIKRVANGL